MTGDDVRDVYEAVLPDEALDPLISESGFQQRERLLQAKQFIRAAVIAAATGQGGRQADALRVYFENGAPRVVRGASCRWFNKAFEAVMEGVRDRTFAYARSLTLDLPGVLGAHVRDWHIVDSTTVKLDRRLKAEYPGSGDYAALKLHKRFSIGLARSGTTTSARPGSTTLRTRPSTRPGAGWACSRTSGTPATPSCATASGTRSSSSSG